MIITQEITVDVARKNAFNAIVAKQLDLNSRFLKIKLTDMGNKLFVNSNATALIDAQRPDNNAKSFKCVVNDDGTITAPLKHWMLELEGYVKCDIAIVDADNSKLTSTTFSLLVEKRVCECDTVTDDDGNDLIVTLINDVSVSKEDIENIKSNINNINTDVSDIRTAADGTTYETAGEAVRAQVNMLNEADDELMSHLTNLKNYYFFENYSYDKIITDSMTGNNVTVARGIELPIGDYYIYAKFAISGISVTTDYVRLYVQQANYNGNFKNVNADGDYILSETFSITAEGSGNIRIDHNTSDSGRTTTLKSLFIVKNDDSAIEAININNSYRRIVIGYIFDENDIPSDVAKIQDIKNIKTELDTEIFRAEPIFDLLPDYGNRNATICLIGDSTSDGSAGPAAGIYWALSLYQCSGEILDGVSVVDMGSNGSTAEAYIGSYESGSGKLYDAIELNSDIYVVCLGINDIRQGLCDKDTLKTRIRFIVNEILNNTKARVILRTPNSLGSDDTSETYIVPYTSAQEYTDILWETYDELKNEWDITRVRCLDMQSLIFGRESIPSASNPIMGDVLHPNSITTAYFEERLALYGMDLIGMAIAYALGKKEKPNKLSIIKAKRENETAPYLVYPQILDSAEYRQYLIYDNWALGGLRVYSNNFQIYGLLKSDALLKRGDILRFGNKVIKVYNGESLSQIGDNLYFAMSFTDEEQELINGNVWHVSVYRFE